MTIDFKGSHYPKSVILYAVLFYIRYGVSYRELEEIMAERGIEIDHATVNRWVVAFWPLIAANALARKKPTAISWRMDETYIKALGKWMYHYRAVDPDEETLDFMLTEHRDTAAARRFFKRTVAVELGEEGVQTSHLRVTQPEKIRHVNRLFLQSCITQQSGNQWVLTLIIFVGIGMCEFQLIPDPCNTA